MTRPAADPLLARVDSYRSRIRNTVTLEGVGAPADKVAAARVLEAAARAALLAAIAGVAPAADGA